MSLLRSIRTGCSAALLLGLLTACATRPPITAPPSASPAPFEAAESLSRRMDEDVLWGGMIVDTRNYQRHSEIEVVAYPLDERQRPNPDLAEQGRFIALRAGFVEPQEFASGRFVTLRGPITGDRKLQLRGEQATIPEIDARELVLWPRDFRTPKSTFSIGIGIGFGG
jgi:outer membrane lipoprotein